MRLECAEKINEMLSLVDCNCVGKHQSAVQLMDVMLYNQWITPMEKQQIDALRTYQEYDTNVYGFHPRLILLELYKRIYYEDKYPDNQLNELLLEENIYIRMKNVLYWVEFFSKSMNESIVQMHLYNINDERLSVIKGICVSSNRITDKINEIREILPEEELFHFLKIEQYTTN